MGDHLLQQKSFEFALSIIRLYKKLQARQELVLSPQLLRSGTSIGVSVEEADVAPQPQDCLDHLTVAARDARQARYWLKLLQASNLVDVDVSRELDQIDEIISILTAQLSGLPNNYSD